MSVLVIAEHADGAIKPATLTTVGAATKLGGDLHILVVGSDVYLTNVSIVTATNGTGVFMYRIGSAAVWATYPGGSPLLSAQETIPRSVLQGHTKGLSSLAYSPDGKAIASGGWDGTVKLWDAATGKVRMGNRCL